MPPPPPCCSSPSTTAATRCWGTQGGPWGGDPGYPWSSVPLCPQATADVAGGLQGLRLRALSVGGLQGDGGQVEQGFRGCVQVWGRDGL